MTILPDVAPPMPVATVAPPGPLFHREGPAQATYDPDHDFAPIEFVVDGWTVPASCTVQEWHALVATVSSLLAEGGRGGGRHVS